MYLIPGMAALAASVIEETNEELNWLTSSLMRSSVMVSEQRDEKECQSAFLKFHLGPFKTSMCIGESKKRLKWANDHYQMYHYELPMNILLQDHMQQ